MALPMLRRCCGCLPLETGCLILCIISTMSCIAYIVAGVWNLPRHREREQEDNLISMTMVMFSTLSVISNAVALGGIGFETNYIQSLILYLCHISKSRRPGCLQLSLLFNSVFHLCIFLVAIVTCLFSKELKPFLDNPANVALIVVMFLVGAAYSLYYLTVVNSVYRKMKMSYSETALPM